jgi:hypothetical protein
VNQKNRFHFCGKRVKKNERLPIARRFQPDNNEHLIKQRGTSRKAKQGTNRVLGRSSREREAKSRRPASQI